VEQAAENKQIAATRRITLSNLADREGFLGSIFLLPAILYIVLLVAFPFFLAIAFSLTDVTVGDPSLDFVGLDNFSNVIKTPQFRRALLDTFLFTLTAPSSSSSSWPISWPLFSTRISQASGLPAC
jgi:multiple sugar transport system permease protein